MPTKNKIILNVIEAEGGYFNHKDDPGGETMYGVTHKTAKRFKYLWAKHNFNGNMADLPLSLAIEIYSVGWWDMMMLDAIHRYSPVTADKLFDYGINTGRSNAVKSLQRVLNVLNKKATLYDDLVVDGGMGPKTLRAFILCLDSNPNAVQQINIALYGLQIHHYIAISEKHVSNESFTSGWLNRVLKDFNRLGRVIYQKLK